MSLDKLVFRRFSLILLFVGQEIRHQTSRMEYHASPNHIFDVFDQDDLDFLDDVPHFWHGDHDPPSLYIPLLPDISFRGNNNSIYSSRLK